MKFLILHTYLEALHRGLLKIVSLIILFPRLFLLFLLMKHYLVCLCLSFTRLKCRLLQVLLILTVIIIIGGAPIISIELLD